MLLKVAKHPKLPHFITQHVKSNPLLIQAAKDDHRNEPANGLKVVESRVIVRP
jgi:hypothetical protein